MKRRINSIVLVLAVALLAACTDPKEQKQFTFNANLEQPKADGEKVHLVDEQWIYWELNDIISIAGDQDESEGGAQLVDYSTSGDFQDFNGVFMTNLTAGSKYFVGLHPFSEHNEINYLGAGDGDGKNFYVEVDFPKYQNYANDSTFGKQVLPMVAWYGGEWDEGSAPYNLNFRSLAGIVRLQVYNAGSTTKTIKEIQISCEGKQLNGNFIVNNYRTANPYVTAKKEGVSLGENDTVIIIRKSEAEYLNLPFTTSAPNNLLTFYVPLPATNPAGENGYNTYSFTVKVVNSEDQVSSIRASGVRVRRNGITYMKSLGIGETWTNKPTASVSGCGTITRPFKIYDVADMQAVRDAYNGTRTLNGQPLTENTYFRIMRSDIVLTNGNWTSGIGDFVGHMTYYGTSAELPGITNNSNRPIFDSIGSDTEAGVVTGLTVRCNNTLTPTHAYSPLCYKNKTRGSIVDCKISSKTKIGDNPVVDGTITVTNAYNVAGICSHNDGNIRGCGCLAKFSTTAASGVAGICLVNDGTIEGCYASSEMTVSGALRASGICDNNSSGTIKDSYFAARINASTIPWAGIAYYNSGTVLHCEASATGTIITTSTVAGIVGENNTGGLVDQCWSSMPIQGSSVGNIALVVNNGTVRNSFVYYPILLSLATDAEGYGGGLVGRMTGGTVRNCFVYTYWVEPGSGTTKTGGIVGKHEGGNVKVCYCYERGNSTAKLYGSTADHSKFESCYCVDLFGSQSGVTGVTTTVLSDNTDAGLLHLLETATHPDGDLGWTLTTGNDPNVPILVLPSSDKHWKTIK